MYQKILYILLLVFPVYAHSESIAVNDDAGGRVSLSQHAQRVVSLSPHITELLYAVGAAEKIIAAVDYSDFPSAANELPRVGSGYQLDLEAIIGLKPDLIIGWQSGNSLSQLKKLKDLGFNLYLSEPKNLHGIAKNLRDLGVLTGREKIANQQADIFLNGLSDLRKSNSNNSKINVFYQVWEKPLFTVNGQHMISQIIDICGGHNVFENLSVLSPQIDIEAVLAMNPQIIIAGAGKSRENWLENWKKWTSVEAVKRNQLYGINADLIVRHTPRILQGARKMCEHIEKARKNISPTY